MDMTVASLFKHKMRFTLRGVYTEIEEPTLFRRTHYFESPTIENVESMGLNDVNDLHTILCKPLVLYAFSKIVHEDHVIPIDSVVITVGVSDFQKGEDCNLQRYCFENPLGRPELFFTHADVDSRSFPERLLSQPTSIFVNVKCYYCCDSFPEEVRFRREFNYRDHWRNAYPLEDFYYLADRLEEANNHFVGDVEIFFTNLEDNLPSEPYTPPIEPHREDCCVVCLEAKPNILYLDCLHIVICDSCDRLKKTGRENCDVCRENIFERIKI